MLGVASVFKFIHDILFSKNKNTYKEYEQHLKTVFQQLFIIDGWSSYYKIYCLEHHVTPKGMYPLTARINDIQEILQLITVANLQ